MHFGAVTATSHYLHQPRCVTIDGLILFQSSITINAMFRACGHTFRKSLLQEPTQGHPHTTRLEDGSNDSSRRENLAAWSISRSLKAATAAAAYEIKTTLPRRLSRARLVDLRPWQLAENIQNLRFTSSHVDPHKCGGRKESEENRTSTGSGLPELNRMKQIIIAIQQKAKQKTQSNKKKKDINLKIQLEPEAVHMCLWWRRWFA